MLELGQFSGAVQSLVQLMTEQSKQIEQHKLLVRMLGAWFC